MATDTAATPGEVLFRVFFRPVARSARSLRVPVARRARLVARSALIACAAAPHKRNTTKRAKCCMDATGLRRRLRRAGGLRSRPGRRGAAQLRRAARIARRRGHQRAAAGLARGSHRPQAGSPAGSGGSGAQLASHAGQVARGRRRARRAARVARRPGRQGAKASPARGSHRPQAGSPAGSGGSGARLASPAGGVTSGQRRVWRAVPRGRLSSLRRRASGVAPANHARARVSRYGGHSKNSS